MIESRVVGLGIGNYKLARTLINSIYIHILLFQAFRAKHGHQLEQQIRLLLKQLRNSLSHGIFKFGCIRSWNTVPRFRFAPMHVVDRVGVVVFVVPAERREAHANIQPRDHHATDVGFDVCE